MSGGSQARRPAPQEQQGCESSWLGRDVGAQRHPCSTSDSLFRTVETEIIPRLMLLHRQDSDAQRGDGASNDRVSVRASQVLEFAALVLSDRESAEAYLQNLLRRGVDFEALCLQLLAPTARHLGELWNADLCEFTDVTIALSRLQGLVRYLSVGARRPQRAGGRGHAALLVPVPGEQHTLGLTMVCDFFRSSGWDVWADTPSSPEALLTLVREHSFDLVGFSIGNDKRIQALGELIRTLRTTSRNRAVRVLAGGPLLIERPQIAALVGADGTAADARQAMLEAERLVAARDEGR
jgi:MerR family transcriptional regulator, light-induced transcriptional regulator